MTDRPVKAEFIRQAVSKNKASTRQGMLERLFVKWFDGMVYNQIWEDPRADLEAMEVGPGCRIMTIPSGGCNVLNYLVADPARIHAVDLNPYHMHLTRLKIEAMRRLPGHDAFFAFFAHANRPENVENYHKYLRPHLPEETRQYWDGGAFPFGPRIRYFQKNLYNYAAMGWFIRLLHLLAKTSGCRPGALFSARTTDRQQEVFDRWIAPFFNNPLVRLAGRLPFILYSLGIPPRQFDGLKAEAGGDLLAVCRERVRRLACDHPIRENYFAWQAFSRGYDTDNGAALPDYLKKEHYEAVRSRLDRIRLHLMPIHAFLGAMPDNGIDRYVLLDSQDWMEPGQIDALWQEIFRVAAPGARVIFRTATADSPIESSLSPGLMKRFTYHPNRSRDLLKKDRSAIYGGFHLYSVSAQA